MVKGWSREPWASAALLTLALCGLTRETRADEGGSSQLNFRLIVEEAGRCGGETFASQILRRAPSARVAAPHEPALSIRVRLSSEPGVVRGRLTLQEANGFVTERDVTGASCAEVMDALALIAAVFLDPNATTDQPPNQPRRTAPRPQGHDAPGRWRFGVGPAVMVHGAVAPEPTPGFSLLVEAELTRDHIVSPLFSLALMRTLTSRIEVQTSVATLRFWGARVQACPLAWPVRSALTFRPCGLAEVGVINAAGTETADPQRVWAPWLAPGGSLRVELNLSTILVIALDAAAVVPFFRPEFYFDPDEPDTVAFEVPPIGTEGNVGLLMRFE